MAQRYADWMYADESHAIDAQIEALCAELGQLRSRYERYLEEEAVQNDMRLLCRWLHQYAEGSLEAQTYLRDYGLGLLNTIEAKLRAAANDVFRFESESPAAGNFSGGKGDRLNSAANGLAHVRQQLQEAFHDAA